MAGFVERWIGCLALALTVALLTASPSRAEADGEAFEVLVLRGSTIARVTGDGSGPVSEVTVREDPYPPPPPQPRVEEPPPAPEVVIHIERAEPVPSAVPVWRYPLRRPLLRPPDRHRLHDWGSRHQRGSYRLGGRPPRKALRVSPR